MRNISFVQCESTIDLVSEINKIFDTGYYYGFDSDSINCNYNLKLLSTNYFELKPECANEEFVKSLNLPKIRDYADFTVEKIHYVLDGNKLFLAATFNRLRITT